MQRSSMVVFSALVVAMNSFAEPSRMLLDASYNAQRDVSRLVLTFDKPLRFLQKKVSATEVRLSFPQTGSQKYANGIPLIFRNGSAKSVSFDYSRQDTLAVLVKLHENATYDLRREQNQIVMELNPSDTANTVAQFVDIRALVKNQIAEAPIAQPRQPQAQSRFEVQLIPFLAAVIVSLLGTGGLLYWTIRPSLPRLPAKSIRQEPKAAESSGVEAILAQAKLILEEKSGRAKPALAFEDGVIERDDDALTLARKFQRGQGELQLARKLESQNRQFMWEKKLQQLSARQSGREFVASAKKLGVGKGELNLAASLRRMQESQLRKEPLT